MGTTVPACPPRKDQGLYSLSAGAHCRATPQRYTLGTRDKGMVSASGPAAVTVVDTQGHPCSPTPLALIPQALGVTGSGVGRGVGAERERLRWFSEDGWSALAGQAGGIEADGAQSLRPLSSIPWGLLANYKSMF